MHTNWPDFRSVLTQSAWHYIKYCSVGCLMLCEQYPVNVGPAEILRMYDL